MFLKAKGSGQTTKQIKGRSCVANYTYSGLTKETIKRFNRLRAERSVNDVKGSVGSSDVRMPNGV